MKKLTIIANWKSNKTISEAKQWLEEFRVQGSEFRVEDKEIIVCPPFTVLSELKLYILNHTSPIKLGAQDISPFEEGAYTGEINGKQIKEIADYVIIGHSERRKYFTESDELLKAKVAQANRVGLQVIFCVQGKGTPIPEGVQTVAYEPVFAIGTGTPDTPENAQEIAAFFKKEKNIQSVLYGGSIKSENIKNFTQQPDIDGVLVGSASLNPSEFCHILQMA